MTSSPDHLSAADSCAEPEASVEVYRAGDLNIEVDRERVTRAGVEIELPALSLRMLIVLVKAAPAYVSVRALMNEVWPGQIVAPETVSQRIKLLRSALGDDGQEQRYIKGVRGRGYRIGMPVERLRSAVSSPVQLTPAGKRSGRLGAHSQSHRIGWRAAVVALVAGLAALVIVPRVAPRFARHAHPAALSPPARTHGAVTGSPRSARALPPERGRLRLAVLPFDNLSSNPADAFFADGLHEQVLEALAQSAPGVDVISRTTMMTWRDRHEPVSAVAGALHATHILEGSVQREAHRVRLSIQLVDARTDTPIWSQRYDRTLVSALSLQSEVAAAVASQLSVRLAGRQPAAQIGTRDPRAYDLYLQGLLARADFRWDVGREAVQVMEEPLSKAIALDPTFAQAYAERSVARIATFVYNIDTSEEQVERARSDVAHAERLSPGDPKVLAARGFFATYIDQDFPAALAAYDAAESAGLADPMWLQAKGATLEQLGRLPEAADVYQRALSIDPRNSFLIAERVQELSIMRQPLEAIRLLDTAMAVLPSTLELKFARAALIAQSTGDSKPLAALASQFGNAVGPSSTASVDAGGVLRRDITLLEWDGRFREARDTLAEYPLARIRAEYPGVGDQPVAELRGWADLLAGDREAAAQSGRNILDFLNATRVTKWNAFYRRLLTAEAYLFLRKPALAIENAREALRMQPYQRTVLGTGIPSALTVAAVYAWAGDHDDALELIEQLATEVPGAGPGEILLEPRYRIPLAHDPRFQRLLARLNSQAQATKLKLAGSPKP